MRSEERLGLQLAAWREESRQAPRGDARERARTAMHQARLARAGGPTRSLADVLRPRWGLRGSLLAGVSVAAMAVTVLGVLGWNAPAGSPLFQVRLARQGIQLALPGSNAAALHLGFAESDLADARQGENAVSSLEDARNELAAALAALPSNRTSPLWRQYDDDVTSLQSDQERIEGEGTSTPGAGPSAEPGTSEPEGTGSPGELTGPSQSSRGGPASSPPQGGGDSEGSGDGSDSGSGGDH